MIERKAFLLLPMLLSATHALGCQALAEEPHDRCGDLARASDADPSGIEARYEVTYTHLDGTCGELVIPSMVTLDGNQTQTFVAFEVETHVSLNGCSMSFVQIVRDRASDRVQIVVDGSKLVAEDSDTISGRVSGRRFGPLNDTSCLSEYDARLERVMSVLGPAIE